MALRYDTILLDADETLFDFKRSEREAVAEAFRSIGVEADEEMFRVYSEINGSMWKLLERGEIEKKVLFYHRFEVFFERYGITADPHEMADRYMERLAEKGYLLDGARALCLRLREVARLYIVTNGTEFIQRGRYAKSGLSDCFEDTFISDVIGAEKPSVTFFERVAEQIPDFRRERTLIVGDSLTSDMQGGVNFGIDTCWYNPQGKEVSPNLSGKITYIAGSLEEIYDWIVRGDKV